MKIQGTNRPYVLRFSTNMSEFDKLEVNLSMDGETIKHWSKADLNINDTLVECPITEEESLEWKRGRVLIEVKALKDGKTYHFRKREDTVVKWVDKTQMTDDTEDEDD